MKPIITAIFCCFALTNTFADSGHFYAATQVGYGRLEIRDDYLIPELTDSTTTIGLYLTGGYQTLFNLLFEVGGGFGENVGGSLIDNYELAELRAGIGFAIPLGSRFTLVPKAGINRWRLAVEEDQFLNPGPEDNFTSRDTEGYIQLDAEIQIVSFIALDFSIFKMDAKFGDFDSIRFGVQFEF